nr:hypothetical protein [uncultured Mediterranean phage uvMED]
MKKRRIQFRGEHTDLVDGEFYEYLELADYVGASYNCMKNRLYSKKYFTNDDLYPPYSKSGGIKKKPRTPKRLETYCDVLSQKYLRRKL